MAAHKRILGDTTPTADMRDKARTDFIKNKLDATGGDYYTLGYLAAALKSASDPDTTGDWVTLELANARAILDVWEELGDGYV